MLSSPWPVSMFRLNWYLAYASRKRDAGHEHLGPLRALRRQGPQKLPVEGQGQPPGFGPPQRLVFLDQGLHYG